jgi:septum formation protein
VPVERRLTLILASASPRRRRLLETLGLAFRTLPTAISEEVEAGENPEEHATRLAAGKAAAVAAHHRDALVLAADTVVVADGPEGPRLLGKPADAEDARSMLRLLAGREHRVLTAVTLCAPPDRQVRDLSETRVRFAPLDDRLIDWYVATGEPLDKAGAYGVQGAAALFVTRIDGSWTNVVGLPLDRLPHLFHAAGHDLLDFLNQP